jgi:hypothetical protein
MELLLICQVEGFYWCNHVSSIDIYPTFSAASVDVS